MKMRLNRFIALNSTLSRRQADELIRMKRVKVNEEIASVGMIIDPEKVTVIVDFQQIRNHAKSTYLLLYKPKNIITSRKDDKHRTTVMDIIPQKFEKLKPAGRLDFDTEGLIIMTDDGDFINFLTHPKSRVVKEYKAKIFGRLDEQTISKLQRGITVKGIKYKLNSIKEETNLYKSEKSIITVKITHGKNREIRNALKAFGHPVITLQRIKIGNLDIDYLQNKKYRLFSKEDFRKI